MSEQFPILTSARKLVGTEFPASIPWSVIEPHELQAIRNHSQSLRRLSERGGLSWSELELVLLDKEWDGRCFQLPKQQSEYEQSERAAARRVVSLLSAIAV